MSTGQENLIFLWYIKYRNNRVMIKWAPRSCYRWYVYVSPTHTCGTLQLSWATVGCRWFHIKLRWCHIIRGDLVWRGHCFVYSFYGLWKSPGEKKHARTGYLSYHLTMKEHGGCNFDTNHHDFTSCCCLCVCVRLAEVSPGGRWLSAAIGDDQWRELAHSQLLLRTHHEAAEETDAQMLHWCWRMTNLLKGIKEDTRWFVVSPGTSMVVTISGVSRKSTFPLWKVLL